jgi:hypothetical protein
MAWACCWLDIPQLNHGDRDTTDTIMLSLQDPVFGTINWGIS